MRTKEEILMRLTDENGNESSPDSYSYALIELLADIRDLLKETKD